jgi:predicted permease
VKAWLRRLAGVFKKRQHEEDFQQELEANLQMQIDDNIRSGMTLDEARRAAHIKFGSIDATKERVRDRRGIPFLETFTRDIHYAVRMLQRNKKWSTVAILSLALGIGANTAIFNAVNDLFLKQLPVVDPERLVRLRWAGSNDMATSFGDYGYSGKNAAGQDIHGSFSYPIYEALRKSNQTLDGMLAFTPMGNLNVVVDGQAETASGLVVCGDYFRVLGVMPVRGRAITSDDDSLSAAPVAMISYAYWMRRFGGDETIVGKAAVVTGTPVTIIGVTPPGFRGVQRLGDSSPADITLPLSHESSFSIFTNRNRANQPSNWWLYIMGRLKPGVTAQQVAGNLNGVFQQAAREGWNAYFDKLSPENQARNASRTAVPELQVDAGGRGFYEIPPDTVRMMKTLGIVSTVILVIVCANVANLLLARASSRRREISLRLSLGASRSRLIRQLLTESVVLAFFGGGLGILIAYLGGALMPPEARPLTGLDWQTFAFTATASLATGILFGLAPAMRASRTTLAAALNQNSRSFSRSYNILSKSLIVLQVALSLTLLVSAGLFLRTLTNLRRVDSGLNSDGLLVFRLNRFLTRYDRTRGASLFEQITHDLEAMPGIRSVSASDMWLLTGSQIINNIRVSDSKPAGSEQGQAHTLLVAPRFFETMEIPLVVGREFTDRDSAGAPKVAIINETTTRRYFMGQSPIGRTIDLEGGNRDIEIVGIVRDAKFASVREPSPPTVYLPFLQGPITSMNFEVRTSRDPALLIPEVLETIRRIDPELPVMNMSTHATQVEQQFAQERFLAHASSLFGILAAMLSGIGLFGVMSYNVARRTNEIGIRVAIGAQNFDIMQMVLRESLLLVTLGIVLGIASALAANRLIASMLFGVETTDAVTFSLVSLAMLLVSAVAAFLPARRASHVDPMVALRHE